MATATKVKLSSEMQYLNERLKDGRAVLHSGFSMKRLGNPDPAFQPRVVHLDMDHVKTLDDIYQARGHLDPVVIVHVAEGNRDILVDGFHRHEVYKRAGEDAIPAYVIDGTVEDAVEYTAMANQHAILKRNPEDVKKQIYLLLAIPRWFERSNTEIGRHVGVVTHVVVRHRVSYCQERNTPLPTHCISANGKRMSNRSLDGKPVIYKNAFGGYGARLNGRKIVLGRNLSEAQRELEKRLERTEARKEALNPHSFFWSWLPSRGIVLASVLASNDTNPSMFPGIGRSFFGHGRIVITARLDEPSAIYTAIGRLYALREILERPGDRLVMVCVCYPDDGPEAMVEVARRLDVELLTPEEFVASIKGDDGRQGEGVPVGDDPDIDEGPDPDLIVQTADQFLEEFHAKDVGDAGDGPAPAGEAAQP